MAQEVESNIGYQLYLDTFQQSLFQTDFQACHHYKKPRQNVDQRREVPH